MGFGKSIPAGWDVRFIDDLQSNMSAGEMRFVSLRVSSPANADAGYHGFRLFAGSANGNVSFSTLLVVNITATHNLAFTDATNESNVWLPGISGNLSANITNLGSVDSTYSYSIGATSGDCIIDIPTSQGMEIQVNASENIDIEFSPSGNMHQWDMCGALLEATNIDDSSVVFQHWFNISIGVSTSLEWVDASPSPETLTPGQPLSLQFSIVNTGSEEESLGFTIDGDDDFIFSNAVPTSSVDVGRGNSTTFYVDIDLPTDTNLVGIQNLTIEATSWSSWYSENLSLIVDVNEVPAISLLGPNDNRIVVGVDSATLLNFSAENIGTSNLSLNLQSTGLPSGVTVALDEMSNLSFSVGQAKVLSFSVQTSAITPVGDHSITLSLADSVGFVLVSQALTLQVLPTVSVGVSAGSNWVIVGAGNSTIFSINVANLGDASDTISIDLDTTDLGSDYGVSISSQTLTIDAGQSQQVELSLSLLDTPTSSTSDLVIVIQSGLDAMVSDVMILTIHAQDVAAELTVVGQNTTSASGSQITGSAIIKNSGNAIDSFLLSFSGLNCMPSSYVAQSLNPSESTTSIPFSCEVPDAHLSGSGVISVRVQSQTDSSMIVEEQLSYTVSSTLYGSAVTISSETISYSMSYDSSSTIEVVVSNNVNHIITGTMSVFGDNSGLFHAEWTDFQGNSGSSYTLTPLSSTTFSLTLTSMSNQGGIADITLHAISDVDGNIVTDSSPSIEVEVDAIHTAPDGLALPLGIEMSNQTGLSILSGGWIFALLLVMVMRSSRKKRKVVEAEMDLVDSLLPAAEFGALPPPALGGLPMPAMAGDGLLPPPLGASEIDANETMLLPGRKVICPSCTTKLSVPRGSVPPFRFSCPSCEESIRVSE
ncbi:MAG: hypothetical protein CXT69_00730 [Methanobacteriota archaeon]|nr:MAG: hypothetical protein CXT69_00730 [Euryarchaeota archaeon]